MTETEEMALDDKVLLAGMRIQQWHEHWNGRVSVSFSGGLDSTVLLHLVRQQYPDVPAVFADTRQEYPEIYKFVKETPNVIWVRGDRSFRRVVQEEGYPVVSKRVAKQVRILKERKPGTENTQRLYDSGFTQAGKFSRHAHIPMKWRPLIYEGFKVSEVCCHALKTGPLDRYYKKTGHKPFVGTRMAEKGQRAMSMKGKECNLYAGHGARSAPLQKWSDADIWEYIRAFDISYSEIYDSREVGGETILGEERTGCMFCMFGVHLEGGENRFQRMKKTHPRHHRAAMDKLGVRRVLEAIGVDPEPQARADSSLNRNKKEGES